MDKVTKKKTVKGVVFAFGKFQSEDVTVRTTSDSYGKRLSLSIDGSLMLQVNVKDIADMVELVEE